MEPRRPDPVLPRTSRLRPTEAAVLTWLVLASLVATCALVWRVCVDVAALVRDAAERAGSRDGLGPVVEDLGSRLAEDAGVEAPHERADPSEKQR